MKNNELEIIGELKSNSIYRIDEGIRMIEISLTALSEEEVWHRTNNSSNSIANIILHLCGNIRQYIISSLGGNKDVRVREEEFLISAGYQKEQLLNKLKETIQEAKRVIEKSPDAELLRKRKVQVFNLSGIGIIIHVVEHLSYHTGQIAFKTKQLADVDMGFYKGVDLNVTNKD